MNALSGEEKTGDMREEESGLRQEREQGQTRALCFEIWKRGVGRMSSSNYPTAITRTASTTHKFRI